jgi:hypothetical protein
MKTPNLITEFKEQVVLKISRIAQKFHSRREHPIIIKFIFSNEIN